MEKMATSVHGNKSKKRGKIDIGISFTLNLYESAISRRVRRDFPDFREHYGMTNQAFPANYSIFEAILMVDQEHSEEVGRVYPQYDFVMTNGVLQPSQRGLKEKFILSAKKGDYEIANREYQSPKDAENAFWEHLKTERTKAHDIDVRIRGQTLFTSFT